MSELEKALQAAKDKFENEQKKITLAFKTTETLYAVCPGIEQYSKPMILTHELWGSVGLIKFSQPYADSMLKGKKKLDRTALSMLLESLKPEPILMVKDCSKSFRPDGEWKGELSDVFPILIDIEPAHFSNTVSFKWYARINGDLWRIECEYKLYNVNAGKLDIAYEYYRNSGEVKSIVRCNFIPRDNNAQTVKWYGSGDIKTPNNFTVYWDVDSGKEVDFPGYVQETK
jgi:hypothetical protein